MELRWALRGWFVGLRLRFTTTGPLLVRHSVDIGKEIGSGKVRVGLEFGGYEVELFAIPLYLVLCVSFLFVGDGYHTGCRKKTRPPPRQ